MKRITINQFVVTQYARHVDVQHGATTITFVSLQSALQFIVEHDCEHATAL